MTRVVRSAMLGFTLGWVIAVAGACGGNKACGPGTCDGCCDASGVCQQGSSDSSCGDNGATCSACTAPQYCLAGACGTLGPADGGGGGSPATFTEWCDTFSTSYCHALVTCKRVSAADEANCVKLFKDLGCAQNAEGILEGYSTFDRAEGGSCLNQIQNFATTCRDFSFSCQVAVPASTAGEGCSSPSDCVGTDLGCGGPACNKSCQTAGGLDQPCVDGWSCSDGLWCDGATTTCRGPKPLGAACASTVECDAAAYCNDGTGLCTALPTAGQDCYSYRCAAGNYCDFTNNVCKAQLAVGATCSGSECVDTAYCNFSAWPSVCAARRPVGSICAWSEECQQGTYCDGVCKNQVTEGGSCTSYEACAGNLSCDEVTRTCITYRWVDEGQPCTGNALSCDWGLNCHGAATNPDGGVGTMGTCRAPAVGDSCTSGYECPEGAYCKMPTDGGWQGLCATSSLGSPCSGNDDCQTGQYCDAPSWTDGICATQAGLAQPCNNDNSGSCASPYTCKVNGSIAVCGERGGVGSPCTDSGDCTYFNECRNNVCTAVAFQGQPCSEYGFCYDGECVGLDLDAGTSGTCGGKLADGEICFFPSQCQSNSCLGSVCVSCP